jgi:hypothetical protein
MSEGSMFGPLPRLHRLVVSALALIACAGGGAWLAFKIPGPLLAPGGAVLGATLGVVLVALLVREVPRATPARRSRHR